MSTGAMAATPLSDPATESLFPPFLQYGVPIPLQSDTTVAPHSYAHSKLAAAKEAARTLFTSSQVSKPAAPRPLVTTTGTGWKADQSRVDPTNRLATPPVVGRLQEPGRPHLSAKSVTVSRGVPSSLSVKAVQGSVIASPDELDSGVPHSVIASTAAEVLPILMRDDLRDGHSILQTIFPPRVSAVPAAADQVDAIPLGKNAEGSVAGSSASHQVTVVQHISTAPTSREDVALLHDRLLERLRLRRAMPIGLCSIRRGIYQDVFAELVRQVTLEDAGRGVLLQRVKDEVEDSLRIHAHLTARADSFAAKKLLHSESGLHVLRDHVEALEKEKLLLLVQRHDLQRRYTKREEAIEEEGLQVNKKQQEELSYLRRANQQLAQRLKMETERISDEERNGIIPTVEIHTADGTGNDS